MSTSDVTREGLDGVRPDREAQMWSRGGKRRRDREAPRDEHPGDSYYGRPVINAPVWEELDVAGYLFTGGLAGATSILAAGADLTGRPELARRCKVCAGGAISVSLLALIHDLGRPARFLNMLRVFKPTSPMSVGVWILSAYAPLVVASAGSDVLDIRRPVGRAAGVGAAVLGAGVASYTAALVADTAVPVWHDAHRELPFVFVGSAASAAGGFGLLAAPLAQSGPARRMAILGTATELAVEQLMERRLHPKVAEALQQGKAGRRLKLARLVSLGGLLGAASAGHRSRPAAVLSGLALLAGSVLTRFGLFAAGMASAEDPAATVVPQRERAAAREAAVRDGAAADAG